MIPARVVLGAVAVVAGATCGGDSGPSRADVMGALATDVVVPSLDTLATDATAMAADVEAACATPGGATVAAALASVDETRASWLATQAMWTGPIMERRSPTIMDWAVNSAEVEELVTSSAPGELTPQVIAEQVGADNRGLRALRGVLTRDDAVALLGDARWCGYATSVAGAIVAEAEAVLADWTVADGEDPPFADVVADPDEAQEWLAMLVNDDIQLVRLLSGSPRAEGDVPSPDVAADRARQLEGVAMVAGALGPLLDDDLRQRLDGELGAAAAAFVRGDVEDGRALAAEVDKTLATDVAGRLDVTIGFSDADGDGSG